MSDPRNPTGAFTPASPELVKDSFVNSPKCACVNKFLEDGPDELVGVNEKGEPKSQTQYVNEEGNAVPEGTEGAVESGVELGEGIRSHCQLSDIEFKGIHLCSGG